MRGVPNRSVILAALAASLGGQAALAQTAIVTSEFVRYRPDGKVVSSDKADKYRELLSPAVARNAHFTFRVTVVQPAGSPYTLHIAQNPENSSEIKLFQESYSEAGDEWVPDKLKQVDMPHGAEVAKGQTAQSYLVDLFIPSDSAPNQRFRIEVQFHRGDGWMILPMEVRVRQARVDSKVEIAGTIPALNEPLSRAVEAPLRAFACNLKTPATPVSPDSGRALLLRNLLEDLNLARQREKPDTRDGVVFMLLKAAGISDLPAFCTGKASLPIQPEWWLKSRDYLNQAIAVR